MDDRRLFLELAEAGSFAKVARRLGVARYTVMRRIEALEGGLGFGLVQRVSRRVILTDAGRRYAEELRPLLRELARIEERARDTQGELEGDFHVWMPILGTGAHMTPVLAAFQAAHPQVIVHLEMGRDVRQLELGAFDVALQTGFRTNPGLHARTILRDRMILVASRDYIESNGVPATIADLTHHRAVHLRDVEGKLVRWRDREGHRVAMPPPALVVNSPGIAFDLARGGAGIVQVPSLLAAQQLERGELVQLLPEVGVEQAVNLLYLPPPTPTVRAFLDFVAGWFSSETRASVG